MLEFEGKKFTINKKGEYVEIADRKHEKTDFKHGLHFSEEFAIKNGN